MSFRHSRALTLLILASLALTPAGAFAAAKKAETPTGPVADATVNLYCRISAGKKTYSTSGSGVFIDARGVILTNAHVAQHFLTALPDGRVEGRCTVRMGSPAKDRYYADVLYFPPDWIDDNASELKKRAPRGTGENDFALLYVTKAVKGTLPASFPALLPDLAGTEGEGEKISISGYPTEKLNFDKIKTKLPLVVASSTVTRVQGFDALRLADSLTLAPSDAGSPGISGGAITDSGNRLIGIAAAKAAAKDDRTLRGITIPYIDRAIRLQTGASLSSLFTGDFGLRAATTHASVTDDQIRALEAAFPR